MPLRNLLWIAATAVFSLICFNEADRNRYATIMSDTIETISTYYVDPIEHEALFEGGMRGMMRELDPYSGFISASQAPQFKAEIEQHFGGIGIEVGIKNERITVLNPVPDLPAYRAGLHAGDQIASIDGVDVTSSTLDDAVKLMRGPIGTEVQLEIDRPGQPERLAFTLVRAQVTIESVRGDRRNKRGDWSFRLEQEPRIGYIRLTSFGERSTEELMAAIKQIDIEHVDNVDGLIMDLRGNAGGLLTTAVEICDLFIPSEKLVVSTKGRVKSLDAEYFSERPATFPPNKPLVVLVDRFTASAGEIFAACMQDYGRGIIVGQRTWGKGTVQNVIPLSSGRGLIRLTTQSYWRPSGTNIHRTEEATEDDVWGVSPLPENLIQYSPEEHRAVFRRRSQRDLSAAQPDDPSEVEANDDAPDSPEAALDSTDREDEASPELDDAAADKAFPGDRQLERAIEVILDQLSS